MFEVKALKDYKIFKPGMTCTVLSIHNDQNSQPQLLVAADNGIMAWAEAENFRYIKPAKKQPAKKKAPPKKG